MAALAALVALAACSSGGGGTSEPSGGLRPVGAVSMAELTAAAPVVQARLERMGAPVTVTVGDGELVTSGPVDDVLREAAGRRSATELRAVTSTTIGPCPAGSTGTPSLPEGRRCHELGPVLTDVRPIASAAARLEPGIGWSVELFVVSASFAPWRTAMTGAADTDVAVVADGRVLAVFRPTAAVGLHAGIGPGLTEREARRLAAALVVTDPSPVGFEPPSFGTERGPQPDADAWLAALSANVCGTWLPDAPATPDASGIHSHGDGLVYAHPYRPAEAGDKATIGLWLSHGSWTATADRLQLWDGTAHRTGDACPDGRPGVVRWWVDGVEQQGDPEKHRIGNGEAVTLSFNPDGVEPGPPPAAARLPLPRLTPEA